MSSATTIIHLRNQPPEAVEAALSAIFVAEGRAPAPRVEGTYSAVLERAASPDVDAAYRYLLLRPRSTGWTPLLEVGLRADGLDVELSRSLGGATVVSIFEYGGVVAGYRVIKDGAEVDRYLSDPTAFEDEVDGDLAPNASAQPLTAEDIEAARGRPQRFADLLPPGTPTDEFAQVVLRPGWWEEHDTGREGPLAADAGSDDELVDEVDRARCIGLALELWATDTYPLAGDLEDIANAEAGPAIALAWD